MKARTTPSLGALALWVCLLPAASSLGGCASRSSAAQGELVTLRGRVAELEADRRRQGRRVDDLSARLTALEGRATRTHRPRRDLPVVRVLPRRDSPGIDARGRVADGGEEESGDELLYAEEASEADRDGPRPVLRLEGSGDPSSRTAARRPAARSIALAAVTERLPVVPMPDVEAIAPSPTLEQGPPTEGGAAPSPEDVVREARRQLAAGRCDVALEALGGLLARSPEHASAADAMMLRAQCYRLQGGHLRAIGELERLGRRYPQSSRRAEALVLMAESHAAIGDRERAREIFATVLRQFPRSSAASRATVRVQELSRGVRAMEEP